MNTNLSVVLVSGGMDSAVVCSLAAKESQELAFIHISYGQKTSEKEKKCFEQLCDFFHISQEKKLIIDLTFLKKIGGSSLTDDSIQVNTSGIDLSHIPSSYVPFRNSIMLSMAISWCEVLKAKALYIGANEEDSPGYPDCRPDYYRAFQEVIKQGTKDGSIILKTPVISWTKKQIVEHGIKLHTPFHLTWSCYQNGNKACGECDSCLLRLKGFKEAGHVDPISYT